MWVTAVGLKCVYPSACAHLHLCCMWACPCTEESELIDSCSSYMHVCVYSQVTHTAFYLNSIDLMKGMEKLSPAKTITWRSPSNMITAWRSLGSKVFCMYKSPVKLLCDLRVKYTNFINDFYIAVFILADCNWKTSTFILFRDVYFYFERSNWIFTDQKLSQINSQANKTA